MWSRWKLFIYFLPTIKEEENRKASVYDKKSSNKHLWLSENVRRSRLTKVKIRKTNFSGCFLIWIEGFTKRFTVIEITFKWKKDDTDFHAFPNDLRCSRIIYRYERKSDSKHSTLWNNKTMLKMFVSPA